MQLKILDCYADAIKSYYIKLQIAFGNTANRFKLDVSDYVLVRNVSR